MLLQQQNRIPLAVWLRGGALVWFVYLASAKTSTRDVRVLVLCRKVYYSVDPLRSLPTHSILMIMPRQLASCTGPSCQEHGIQGLGGMPACHATGVLLPLEPLWQSIPLAIMPCQHVLLTCRTYLLLCVHSGINTA